MSTSTGRAAAWLGGAPDTHGRPFEGSKLQKRRSKRESTQVVILVIHSNPIICDLGHQRDDILGISNAQKCRLVAVET